MRGRIIQRGKNWSIVLSTKSDNGRWKHKWISTGIKSKKYAENLLNEIMCRVNKSDQITPSKQTSMDYLE